MADAPVISRGLKSAVLMLILKIFLDDVHARLARHGSRQFNHANIYLLLISPHQAYPRETYSIYPLDLATSHPPIDRTKQPLE